MFFHIRNSNGGGSQKPNTIIVHAMSEFLDSGNGIVHASEFLIRYGLSAHALVTPSGDIILCRKDTEIAYHAKGYNKNSLSIELLVPGLNDIESFYHRIENTYWWYQDQFDAAVNLTQVWMEKWKIKKVFRHSDVDPRRKKDPGKSFPWTQFKQRIGL